MWWSVTVMGAAVVTSWIAGSANAFQSNSCARRMALTMTIPTG
jgi:hypothetical protein